MKIKQLQQVAIAERLAGEGILLPCGTFNVRIRSNIAALTTGLLQLYADFPVFDPGEVYVDFEVDISAPTLMRRFVRPQVILRCDGRVPFKPLPLEQAMPMLEWGLNWVISSHAHDHLVLHAAVVERDGRALVLAADPGSGKSTLCAALVHGGWRLLSDELTLVALTDGLIHPIVRPISLKNASIDIVRALGHDIVISQVCHDTTKGSVAHMRPPAASVEAINQRVKPAMLVFPKFAAGAALRSEAVGPAHALIELTRHAFNASVLAADGFDALCGFSEAVQSYRIEYGSFDQVLPEIDNLWQALK